MNGVCRALGSLRDRWAVIGPRSLWAGAAVVVAAWGLIALSRLGGLAVDAPRALARLALVGVWGWLALALAIWVGAQLAAPGRRGVRSLQSTLAIVGLAHTPIIVLASVVLIAAGALEVLGPGMIVAALSLAVVMPLALITGVDHVFGFGARRAAVTVVLPYTLWLVVVARGSLRQVEHLL
ncbi:MAG: hypothetical protein QNM02_19290 [Acidimicrobiia bacterium]|nr:hypothetical protein [Acidimicrobiia bacterium]